MCYDKKEVNAMEEERNDMPQPEEQSYTPRPAWQVWLARIGLVLFILVLVMYYVNLFRGGA